MKNTYKILCFVCLLPFQGFSNGDNDLALHWNDLESALIKSKDHPKPIFIEFTAKWCGWCKKMEKTTFKEEKVINLLNEEFYAVKIDFDSPDTIEFKGKEYTGKSFAKSFGISGLPTMIYIPADQNGSETIVGYKTGKQLLKELKKLTVE